MDITKDELEKVRFFLEVQYREKLVHKPEFPFLQSIGMKDIFQGFKHPSGTYLGMLHLKWSSGTTWLREGWFDSKEEAEDFIRKLYDEKIVDILSKICSGVYFTFFDQKSESHGICMVGIKR